MIIVRYAFSGRTASTSSYSFDGISNWGMLSWGTSNEVANYSSMETTILNMGNSTRSPNTTAVANTTILVSNAGLFNLAMAQTPRFESAYGKSIKMPGTRHTLVRHQSFRIWHTAIGQYDRIWCHCVRSFQSASLIHLSLITELNIRLHLRSTRLGVGVAQKRQLHAFKNWLANSQPSSNKIQVWRSTQWFRQYKNAYIDAFKLFRYEHFNRSDRLSNTLIFWMI